jgi:hypothetical protein
VAAFRNWILTELTGVAPADESAAADEIKSSPARPAGKGKAA